MKTLNILCLAGYGDILSHMTRTKSLHEKYPDHKIHWWLGGFGKAPQFSKEQLERHGYEASIIKNLTYHNQLPQMKEFLTKEVVKEGDLIEDWSFCHEIFNNEDPVFMQYEMEEKFEYNTSISATVNYDFKKSVIIRPLTKSGNAEGFDSDVERGRFWKRESWIEICKKLSEDGLVPTFVGIGDEDWGIIEELDKLGIEYNNMMGLDVVTTMEIIKISAGCIACNSWDWSIAARCGKPTICFYTKNHFFIKIHIPQKKSDFYKTCYIETDPNADVEDVYPIWVQLYHKRVQPKVEHSVCMITLDDDDCVEKTLDNVYEYLDLVTDFVIVDGGSTDKTITIIEDNDTEVHKIMSRKWDDNFAEQKNYALEQAKSDWRVWLDADEIYESLFWNQLPWYIWRAEQNGIDCINVPRINTIEDISNEELRQYAQRNGWNLVGFNWVNYPDYQQRVFKRNCSFVGRTHERITGYERDTSLLGVHILHPKTMSRQQRGLDREKKQYEIEAQKIHNRVMEGE